MNISELQNLLSKLTDLLRAGGKAGKVPNSIDAFIVELEPFKKMTLKAVIKKLAEQPKAGTSAGGSGSSSKKKKVSQEEKQRITDRVKWLFTHATNPTVTHEHIRAACGELDDANLTVAELVEVAQSVNVVRKLRSKAKLIEAIRIQLLETKDVHDRARL